jgi:hypothetical protein
MTAAGPSGCPAILPVNGMTREVGCVGGCACAASVNANKVKKTHQYFRSFIRILLNFLRLGLSRRFSDGHPDPSRRPFTSFRINLTTVFGEGLVGGKNFDLCE